uniref:NADH-ubiquinone oxidoreductase chain 2 n=1 Tax=Platysaurus capensis TaxID=52175 RepID=P92706_9SAUR|nr:NADH dehydrogenase subunit II [Platysaurus capensis]AAT09474.1 NADH dehydrogenase subunit 2 [Platysaurus capensis]
MNPHILTLMLSSLAIGTIITMSSTHWLIAWAGLEINTLAIIPLITKPNNPRATEAATKYFLTQAAASSMILFSSTFNAWHTGQWDISQLTNEPACTLLTLALAMKLGLAPLHFWLPEVMQGTSIKTTMIITTWMKLAPMTLLLLIHNSLNQTILLTMGILSILVGGWGGLNQTQLRKIMGFSSISHLGWMTMVLIIAPNTLILALLIYITMTLAMFTILLYTQAKTIENLMFTWTVSPTLSTFTMIILLSLGGLPPLTGFMPKWLILQELVTQQMLPAATASTILTLLSLFFYLRLSYVSSLITSPNQTPTTTMWRFKLTVPPLAMLLTAISTLTLPMTPSTI